LTASALLAAGWAGAAFAADGMPRASLAGYVVQQDLEVDFGVGRGELDDSGFGLKGWGSLGPNFFAHFEYQDIGGDIDSSQYRVGGGYWAPLGANQGFWLSGEYVDYDGLDGLGLHLGGHTQLSEAVGVYGSLGFLDLEDEDNGGFEDDGLELLVGAEVALVPGMSLFAEFRNFDGDVVTIQDLHLGLNYYFY
jgi:hypothetical protein